MADAGGGGSDWGPLEIILVIILGIGLLSQLTGKPITSPDATSGTVSKTETTNPSNPSCGLTLSRPHSLESVNGFVTLIGQTHGCEWSSSEEVALYAQIVDSRGKPVSEYVTVAPTNFVGGIASFTTTITLTATPAKGNGYLILISPASSSTTYRIPLRFK